MRWLDRLFSSRGRASAVYQRGIEKAKANDHAGALADYNAVIAMAKAPADIKAMASFNRGLIYYLEHDAQRAIEAFEAVVSLPHAPANVVSAAREKLERMKRRSDRSAP
jgi:hypothetical protein